MSVPRVVFCVLLFKRFYQFLCNGSAIVVWCDHKYVQETAAAAAVVGGAITTTTTTTVVSR